MLDLTDWQNKKYTTRRGFAVRVLCIDAAGNQPIVGQDSCGDVIQWSIDGSFHPHGGESGLDIINAKTKKEGWVQVNSKSVGIGRVASTTHVHPTPEKAMENGWGPAYPCVKIEWEE